jgi:hypothetical protein
MSIKNAINAKLNKIQDTRDARQLRIDAEAVAEVVIRWWGDQAFDVLLRAAKIAKGRRDA